MAAVVMAILVPVMSASWGKSWARPLGLVIQVDEHAVW